MSTSPWSVWRFSTFFQPSSNNFFFKRNNIFKGTCQPFLSKCLLFMHWLQKRYPPKDKWNPSSLCHFFLYEEVFKHFPLLQKPLSKPKNLQGNVYFSFMLTSFCHFNFFKKFGVNLCPRILLVGCAATSVPRTSLRKLCFFALEQMFGINSKTNTSAHKEVS